LAVLIARMDVVPVAPDTRRVARSNIQGGGFTDVEQRRVGSGPQGGQATWPAYVYETYGGLDAVRALRLPKVP
jgi:hypothetical protein